MPPALEIPIGLADAASNKNTLQSKRHVLAIFSVVAIFVLHQFGMNGRSTVSTSLLTAISDIAKVLILRRTNYCRWQLDDFTQTN